MAGDAGRRIRPVRSPSPVTEHPARPRASIDAANKRRARREGELIMIADFRGSDGCWVYLVFFARARASATTRTKPS